ncbi:MAG: stage II sporulation protein R [Ruminococcus sp.]|nr:stage II sporulation protein R [Ruminococcus sp.]
MKIFMKVIVSLFVISVMFSMIPFESTCVKLQSDVLRLHILANSDSATDQQLKLEVRDKVIAKIAPLYEKVENKEQAIDVTKANLGLIEQVAQTVVDSHNADYNVNAIVTNEFFGTRYYDDFTMPAGMYDTLQITIGEAQGKNWWCVMYPTLCVGASSKISMEEDLSDDEYKVITSQDIEYKFKIVEYYESIKSFFK